MFAREDQSVQIWTTCRQAGRQAAGGGGGGGGGGCCDVCN